MLDGGLRSTSSSITKSSKSESRANNPEMLALPLTEMLALNNLTANESWRSLILAVVTYSESLSNIVLAVIIQYH